jgi:hypothetical protein
MSPDSSAELELLHAIKIETDKAVLTIILE